MMMLGPIVDSGCLALGGLAGAALGRIIPERIKTTLPLIFGVITVSLGSMLVPRGEHFPVVVLALILGSFLGELCYVEKGLEIVLRRTMLWSRKSDGRVSDGFMIQFVTLIAAICFGSMGIFGAVNEGITGNPDILLTKAVLDLFSGLIFGASMGWRISLIALPQFAILAGLYFSGHLIMAYVSPPMLANFTSAGGVIFLATGLRMCGIKIFPVVNMLPSLILIFPATALWVMLMV
ncbi:DUF554 domain-containing protein [Desulfovibrio sp. OttesenSCG-928-C14]|nr:DUF554 domain-containing protein [Desulfovibrio sp. OttesenSCG-928-C14]